VQEEEPSEEDGEEDSSDSEEVWNAEEEKDFLRTLGALKSDSPRIYDQQAKFYTEREDDGSGPCSSKSTANESKKTMFLRDYERKLVLERGGRLSDDEDDAEEMDDEDDDEEAQGTRRRGPTDESYLAAEKRLKDEFKKAVADLELSNSDDSEAEEGGLLKKKTKSDVEKDQEDADFNEWLRAGGSSMLDANDRDLRKLRDRWTAPELDEDERFLRDYLLTKKYETDGHGAIPSYKEIVGSDEDEEEERATQFEHKFNFRFEEPDQEFIKKYPRTVKESIRPTDNRRKRKRAQEKERKEEIRRKLELELAEEEATALPFKYRSVPANSFGLSVDEILRAEDAQLNAWAPIKKVSQYRDVDEEKRDAAFFARKAQNQQQKRKIFHAARSIKTDTKVKEPEKIEEPVEHPHENGETKKPKKKRQKHMKKEKQKTELDTDRLRAYGVSTKKLKRLQYNKLKDAKEGGKTEQT